MLIASPSDTAVERDTVREVIYEWNALYTSDTAITLLPVMWETHTSPDLSDRPQGVVNRQVVDTCDVLIATFWTRLGAPTGLAPSGTVEEIERFIQAGKRVLLYFSDRPPDRLAAIDPKQLRDLRTVQEQYKARGLIGVYGSLEELRQTLLRHLTIAVKEVHGEYVRHRSSESPSSKISTVPLHAKASLEQSHQLGWDAVFTPSYSEIRGACGRLKEDIEWKMRIIERGRWDSLETSVSGRAEAEFVLEAVPSASAVLLAHREAVTSFTVLQSKRADYEPMLRNLSLSRDMVNTNQSWWDESVKQCLQEIGRATKKQDDATTALLSGKLRGSRV